MTQATSSAIRWMITVELFPPSEDLDRNPSLAQSLVMSKMKEIMDGLKLASFVQRQLKSFIELHTSLEVPIGKLNFRSFRYGLETLKAMNACFQRVWTSMVESIPHMIRSVERFNFFFREN